MEKVLTLKMDEQLYEKLRCVSFKEHCSMGELTRKALGIQLEKFGEKNE